MLYDLFAFAMFFIYASVAVFLISLAIFMLDFVLYALIEGVKNAKH